MSFLLLRGSIWILRLMRTERAKLEQTAHLCENGEELFLLGIVGL
jgi:hypothetical protein